MGTWTPGPGPTSGDDVFVGDETGEIADGGEGNDVLISGGGGDSLNGSGGDDYLATAGGWSQSLIGGSGFDTLVVQKGTIIVDPGSILDGYYRTSFTICAVHGIDALNFGAPASIPNDLTVNKVIDFSSSQIDVGNVSPFLQITGVVGQSEVIEISMSGLGNVDLSNWTFADWTSLSGEFDPGVEDVIFIYGNDSSNQLLGSSQGDIILAAGGNDYIDGGGGDDILNGGAGTDRALYDSIHSGDAAWVRNADGSWTVASAAGVDTLIDIERLRFSNAELRIFDHPERTFSGDGTSDILFRRNDGIMASWDVTDTTIASAAFLPTAGAEWSVLGTGDISGDGRDDVIWQRSDGLVYSWIMNGGSVSAAIAHTGIGSEWTFLGVGDFNGDLTDDLAWQRDDGLVYIWSMNNAAISGASAVTGLGAEWQIAGFGDFNGDGRDDFLWRRSDTGRTVLWHMNGSSIQSSGQTSTQAGLDWSIVGVGDTNGDGRDDIILQRASDGMIAVWAMNGTTVSSATNVLAADPNVWTVRNIGDYNGDGRDDILWQHDNGLVYVWLLNGASIIGAGALSGVDGSWSII